MIASGDFITHAIVALFIVAQLLYAGSILVDIYIFSLPVNTVDMKGVATLSPADYPDIVMLYPVLREPEETMRTTFESLRKMVYPTGKFEVVAIPNSDDLVTLGSLHRLQQEFPFLHVLEVPPTTDPAWNMVWSAWEANPKAYWWHEGRRAHNAELPPKKTRQLIFGFYTLLEQRRGRDDFLVNYIDADSCPPADHLLGAAVGIQKYDVLQALNVAGNLNASLAAGWHALDHMAWDGKKYGHLSSNGRNPYWVLGKGLFFRASDLETLGAFHPWITIEDPEVGMRFWANGKRLGILESPLIEETPATFGRGVTQRKRWICGFFQSLGEPLDRLGMSPLEKLKAWMIFLPCLSLAINVIGIPTGIWALWALLKGMKVIPLWVVILAIINSIGYVVSMTALYLSTWKRTKLVLDRTRDRLWYMLKINPLFVMVWYLLWIIPIVIGLKMYMSDGGLVWERTEKFDANHSLIRQKIKESPEALQSRPRPKSANDAAPDRAGVA